MSPRNISWFARGDRCEDRDGNIHRGKATADGPAGDDQPSGRELVSVVVGSLMGKSAGRGEKKFYRANDNWGRGNANRRDP